VDLAGLQPGLMCIISAFLILQCLALCVKQFYPIQQHTEFTRENIPGWLLMLAPNVGKGL